MHNRRLVIWIVAGVFLWGAVHAVGAYLNFHETDNPWRVRRAVIVLLCVEGFLGFWLLMLGMRKITSPANRNMIWGALWFLGGVGVTAASYLMASSRPTGTYIVAWGAIAFGAVLFLRGVSQAGERRIEGDAGGTIAKGGAPAD
jgi:hypothetical protein